MGARFNLWEDGFSLGGRVLWNYAILPPPLDRLCAAFDPHFVEQFVAVCLHGTDGDKKALGDFAIAQAFCHQLKDLQLPFAQVKAFNGGLVDGETGRRRRFMIVACGPPGQCSSQPDSESCEQQGNQTNVHFEGVVSHDEFQLQPVQKEQQCGEAEAIQENMPVSLKEARE